MTSSLFEMPEWCMICCDEHRDILPAIHYPVDVEFHGPSIEAFYACQYDHRWSCWWYLEEKTVQVRREIPKPDRIKAGQKRGKRSRAISQAVKIAVAIRDQGSCVQCGATDQLEYDHIYPWSRGGSSSIDNIQLLCKACNRDKKDYISQ